MNLGLIFIFVMFGVSAVVGTLVKYRIDKRNKKGKKLSKKQKRELGI